MSILIIHPASSFGGASKSLCELAKQIISPQLSLHVICPKGKVVEAFSSVGMHVTEVPGLSQVDNTRFGHYRGVRWLLLLREIAYLPFSISAIAKQRSKGNYDLIHLNEITLLPLGILAKRWLRIPLVVHVRSLQNQHGPISRWVARALARHANAVIAIDETVKRTLPEGLSVDVIHNGLAVDSSSRAKSDHVFRVGIVGLLLKLKGVYEFAEAARILLTERGINAEFWMVGENARPVHGLKGWLLRKLDFARDVRGELQQFVVRHDLSEQIRFTGFVSDVQSVYRELDVLCFPSYLDAAGRPVFEAAFFQVPSIVAVKNPPPDTIVHQETGLCIEGPDPVALADAIEYMYRHPEERVRMGGNAKRLAEKNFDIVSNARKVLAVYERVLTAASSRTRREGAGGPEK